MSLGGQVSQTLIQSLGLQDILAQRQREAEQLGQARVLQSQADSHQILGNARRKKGTFETIGSIIGGAGGFIYGGPSGAASGSRIGSGVGGILSGVSGGLAPESTASKAIGEGFGLLSKAHSLKVEKEEKKLEKAEKKIEKERDFKLKQEERLIDLHKQFEEVEEGSPGAIEQTISGHKRFFRTKDEKSKERKLSPEKTNIAKQGRFAFESAKPILDDLLKDPDGLTKALVSKDFGGPASSAKIKNLRSSFKNALDSIVRFRTGAAITKEEISFYEDVFSPQVGDSSETVKFKAGQLDAMITIMEGKPVGEHISKEDFKTEVIKTLSENEKALKWAKENPGDDRSKSILERLKGLGVL